MQRQTSPRGASGDTGFAMLPSAHRKPERRDSKAFKGRLAYFFLNTTLVARRVECSGDAEGRGRENGGDVRDGVASMA